MTIRLGKRCLQVQQVVEVFPVLVLPIQAANNQIQWAAQSRRKRENRKIDRAVVYQTVGKIRMMATCPRDFT